LNRYETTRSSDNELQEGHVYHCCSPSSPAIARSFIFLDPNTLRCSCDIDLHVLYILVHSLQVPWPSQRAWHIHQHSVDMSLCNLLKVDSHVVGTSNPTGQFGLDEELSHSVNNCGSCIFSFQAPKLDLN
jgi:hypothetical protein